jgi:phosphoglycerol transferase MdoB-like AlkP superfamily enzyme
MKIKLTQSIISYVKNFTPLLIILLLFRLFESLYIAPKYFIIEQKYLLEISGLYFDLWTGFFLGIIVFIPFFLLYLINKKLAVVFQIIANLTIIILSISLLTTFAERSSMYDREFFTRSFSDTWLIVKTIIGANYSLLILLILILAFYALGIYLFQRIIKQRETIVIKIWIALSVLTLLLFHYAMPNKEKYSDFSSYSLVSNKVEYFIYDSFRYLRDENEKTKSINDKPNFQNFKAYLNQNKFEYTDSLYPLMHKETSKNVLGNFFDLHKEQPNIVFIMVEGLSRAFSGPDARLGSFTPFLDSLAQKSLYWDNCLSSAYGSFGLLSSVLGSLPFNTKGFTNIGNYPNHVTIMKILRNNGYYGYYFSGASLSFDNFGPFMRAQGTDCVLMDFDSIYKKMPATSEGYSSGYPDDALFNQSISKFKQTKKQPFFSVYFTLTTHDPFLFDQKKEFDRKVEKILNSASHPEYKTLKNGGTKDLLSAFLFTDDCLRKYFEKIKKEPYFKNTIFVISGDHNHGAIPASNSLCTYHVPLLIYSPMLKKTQRFYSVNSHNNIPQTILALLKANGNLKKYPKNVPWIADVLDTAKEFRNIHTLPMMFWGYSLCDLIHNDYYLNDNSLYKISKNFNLEKYQNKDTLAQMQKILASFKEIDKYVVLHDKLYVNNDYLHESRTLLKEYALEMKNGSNDLSIVSDFNCDNKTGNIQYELNFEFNANNEVPDKWPVLVLTINDLNSKKNIYWGRKTLNTLTTSDIHAKSIICYDQDNIQKGNSFSLQLWNITKMQYSIKNLKLRIYKTNNESSL